MESNITCPICGNQAKHTIFSSEICLEEEYITCEYCGYLYEFAYGNYREILGNKCYCWNYRSNSHKVNKKLKKAIFNARRRWKKYKKGVTVKNLDYDGGEAI